jgi:hypothetical protein
MSVCVDYFFNHAADLPTLAQSINGWLGCSLSPNEGDANDWFCRFLDMEFSLSKHSFERDREINFEDYTFQLNFRTPWAAADLREIQLPMMTLIAYALYSRMKITGMLVFELQTLLARYEDKFVPGLNEARMYDLVSQQIVEFPGHLISLFRRLPPGRL